jgi:hypothetical protein
MDGNLTLNWQDKDLVTARFQQEARLNPENIQERNIYWSMNRITPHQLEYRNCIM